MQEKYILISIIIFIVIVIFITIVLITIKNNKTIVETKIIKTSGYPEDKPTIKDMTEIAVDRNSTQEDLKKAIDIVAKELPFPKKIKFKLPKDVKTYLHFILLIASHKNADAKLIAYMDEKLKEANKEYHSEIDIYENQGLLERNKRI
ncbi:MAG: hypothetical protein R3331_08375 [Sulfurospirillaceae bacterium]|nr:hypothetical protein [Sulfurospirillaceae bacterium]